MADANDIDLGGAEETKVPDTVPDTVPSTVPDTVPALPPTFGMMRGDDESDDDDDVAKDRSFTVSIPDDFSVEGMPWRRCAMGRPVAPLVTVPQASIVAALRDVVQAAMAKDAVVRQEEEDIMDSLTSALGGLDLPDNDGRKDQAEHMARLATEVPVARGEYDVQAAAAAAAGVTLAPFMEPRAPEGTNVFVVPPSLSYELRRRSAAWFMKSPRSAIPAGVPVDRVLDEMFAGVHKEALDVGGSSRPDWMKDRYFTLKWSVVGVTTRSCLVVLSNSLQFVAVPVQEVLRAVANAGAEPVDVVALANKAVPLAFTTPMFHRTGHSKAVIHDELMHVTTPDGSVYVVAVMESQTTPDGPYPDPATSPFPTHCPGLVTAVHVLPSADYRNPPSPVAMSINNPTGGPPTTVFLVWCPTAAGAMAAEVATTLATADGVLETAVSMEQQDALHALLAREAAVGLMVPRRDAATPPTPFDFKVGTLLLSASGAGISTPHGVLVQTWARHPAACAPLHDVYMGKRDDTKAFAKALEAPPDPDKSYSLVVATDVDVLENGHVVVAFTLHNNSVLVANPTTMTLTTVPIVEEAALDTVKRVRFIKSALLTAGTEFMTISVPGTISGTSVETQNAKCGELMPPAWFRHMIAGSDPARPAPVVEDDYDEDDGGAGDTLLPLPKEDADDVCEDEVVREVSKVRRRGVTFSSDLDKVGEDRATGAVDAASVASVTRAELDAAVGRTPWGAVYGVRRTRVHPARVLNSTVCRPGSAAQVRSGMGSDLETVLGMDTVHAKLGAKQYIMMAVVTMDHVKTFMICAGVEAVGYIKLKDACSVAWQKRPDKGAILLHVRNVSGRISTFDVRPTGTTIAMEYVNLCVPTADSMAGSAVVDTDTATCFGGQCLAVWSRVHGNAALIVPRGTQG